MRNYCANGRIRDSKLIGKTSYIPENTQKPDRINKKKDAPSLLQILREQKAAKMTGGIYHKIQIDPTYNSNHIEGNRLTHDQTRYIFETNTIGFENESVNVDDVIETSNHFRCIDMVIDQAGYALTEKFIKELHFVLKTGTSASRKDWFKVGDYKKLPNEVGGNDATLPEDVAGEMCKLLAYYNALPAKTFEDSNNNQLVFDNFDKAVSLNPGAHPLFHSDRGYQYTSKTFYEKLQTAKMRQSMSRVGRCIDNGPMESFWGMMKSEMYYLRRFTDRDELIQAIDSYIYFYNHARFQKRLHCMTPMEFHYAYAA